MLRPLFLPTARQTNWLIIVAVLALGEALYVRYMVIENTTAELACRAGLQTWLCSSFWLSLAWSEHAVFGGAALATALLNLLRPSVVLVGLSLMTAGCGLVLHNTDLAALAAGLLILSLARPAPAAE
jgi:hypothetical protein